MNKRKQTLKSQLKYTRSALKLHRDNMRVLSDLVHHFIAAGTTPTLPVTAPVNGDAIPDGEIRFRQVNQVTTGRSSTPIGLDAMGRVWKYDWTQAKWRPYAMTIADETIEPSKAADA